MADEPDGPDDEETIPEPGSLDADAFAEVLLQEVFGEAPSTPPFRPLPAHWDKLRMDVILAGANHRLDPENCPLHKLGRFELRKLFGEGSYGLVFEGRDPDLDRPVAIKLCQVREGMSVDKVLDEARTLAKVSHPNVIAVHEIGRWEGDVFFVMDFAAGKSVHHFVERTLPPWQTIVNIYLGAGKGLAAAHEHDDRIIHGDFKPGNVLVEADGSWPRVADFGIARVGLKHTPDESEPAHGTLAAPETLRGLKGDEHSDQWSFCESVWRSLEQLEAYKPGATASVPEQLRDVLRRGLQHDPRDRWPDMRALLAAMKVARRAGPQLVDVVDLEPGGSVLPRRRKGPGWGPSAIALLFAAGSMMVAARPWRASEDRPTKLGLSWLVRPTSMAPAQGCARGLVDDDHEIPLAVKYVCELIRAGEWKEAVTYWERKYNERHDAVLAEKDETSSTVKKHALGIDSLILAQTAASQAERFVVRGDHPEARNAARIVRAQAAEAASMLGEDHAGVLLVKLRREMVLWLLQPKHSTTPLPSIHP